MKESRGIRKGLSAVLLIILLILLPSTALATWTIEDVDAPKWFTDFYSRAMALDTLDRPHIAYGGDHLYHAYFDGTQWQYEVVDSAGGVGASAAIAVDSNGKLHISYTGAGGLKYATNASGSWVRQTVDSNYGDYTSIAVDSNNKVHISYYDSNWIIRGLRYATNASGSWVIQTLDIVLSTYYTSIALDSN